MSRPPIATAQRLPTNILLHIIPHAIEDLIGNPKRFRSRPLVKELRQLVRNLGFTSVAFLGQVSTTLDALQADIYSRHRMSRGDRVIDSLPKDSQKRLIQAAKETILNMKETVAATGNKQRLPPRILLRIFALVTAMSREQSCKEYVETMKRLALVRKFYLCHCLKDMEIQLRVTFHSCELESRSAWRRSGLRSCTRQSCAICTEGAPEDVFRDYSQFLKLLWCLRALVEGMGVNASVLNSMDGRPRTSHVETNAPINFELQAYDGYCDAV